MKHQKKSRLSPFLSGLLTEGKSGGEKNVRLFRRLGALISFLLCGSVILLALGGGLLGVFSGHGANRLATWLAEGVFLDLSSDETQSSTQSPSSAQTETAKESGSVGREEESEATTAAPSSPSRPPLTEEALYAFDYSKVPDGAYPIVPMDLSLSRLGNTYINNATSLTPDLEALLEAELPTGGGTVALAVRREPKVLILHTHGTEGYSEEGSLYYEDDGSELARSDDVSENVVAVGRILADALNEAGIYTLHCEVMHDQAQYKDSYARSAETIRRYLAEYPSIRLVIDLHRDSILKSDGSLVRPVTLSEGEAVAQVMCVVGSNQGGGDYDSWEKNLSLALKLRATLNGETERLCRPVYLKSSTYNQEIAPYSLLLEIGAGGNSLEEAKRAAELVAKGLCEWLPKL